MITQIKRGVDKLLIPTLPAKAGSSRPAGSFALGLLCVAIVAVAAVYSASALYLPPVVVALGLGLSARATFSGKILLGENGIRFCSQKLLKIGIALLGVRVVAGDLAALGPATLLTLAISVLLTLTGGYFIARLLGQSSSNAAISSTSVAICGASAALAASSALPDDGDKEHQTGLIVLVVSLLSTVVMILYPLVGHAMGLSGQSMAVLLGGAIHDVAQVAGAGMSLSPEMGVEAVMVKMVRVACLLPVVASLAFLFRRRSGPSLASARVPVPWFLIGFLLFALIASSGFLPTASAAIMGNVASMAILAAVGAIGLSTGPRELLSVHPMLVVTMVAQTLWQLAVICLFIHFIWQ